MKEKIRKVISLAQTKTAKNTYLVFIGNSLAGLIGMFLMIILSRSLGPEEFGVFSVSFAFLSLLGKFGDLGLNFGMVKDISQSRVRERKGKTAKIFQTVFFAKAIICLAIVFLGVFLAKNLSVKFFNSVLSTAAIRWLSVLFPLFVFYDLVRVYFEANKRFLESSLMYISANLIKLVAVVALLVFWSQFKNFILIYLLSPFAAGWLFFPRTKLRLKLKFYQQEFKNLLGFSSWMAVSVVAAAVGENLNVLMTSSMLSAYQAGIYSAAEKFILPFYVFAGALGTVLISRASEFLEVSHIKRFIKKVAVLQLIFLGLVMVIFPLTPFLPLVLGREYLPSVKILQILIIASYFRLAITPLNSVFYPLNKSIIFAIDALLQAALLFVLNQQFLPRLAAKGAAWSLLIVDLTIFVLNYLFLFFVLRQRQRR